MQGTFLLWVLWRHWKLAIIWQAKLSPTHSWLWDHSFRINTSSTLECQTCRAASNLDYAALQINIRVIAGHKVLQKDPISPGKLPALLFCLCQKINETIYWKIEVQTVHIVVLWTILSVFWPVQAMLPLGWREGDRLWWALCILSTCYFS